MRTLNITCFCLGGYQASMAGALIATMILKVYTTYISQLGHSYLGGRSFLEVRMYMAATAWAPNQA